MLKNKIQAFKNRESRYSRLRHFKVFIFILFYSVSTLALLYTFIYAQNELIYDASGRRDPFIALVTSDGRLLQLETQPGDVGLKLEGIIYHKEGQSFAIVNGEIIKVNDKVGEYEVYKIEEKRVIFTKDGKYVEVKLEEGE